MVNKPSLSSRLTSFFETGKFGDDLDFLLGLVDFDIRPSNRLRAERRDVERAERIVEQPIHLAVKREERVGLTAARAQVARAVVPRN
jgi:hypothetical protein